MSLLLIKIDVKAATCSTDELNALKIEANNLEFEYELKEDKIYISPNASIDSSYYSVSILNYSKNLTIYNNGYNYDEKDLNAKNEIVFSDKFYHGTDIIVEVYGSRYTNCANKLLISKEIKFPYYNAYSEREECKGYENYNICKKDANTSGIQEEEFLKLIDDIKKKEQEPKEEPTVKEEKKSLVDLYLDNGIITIPITIMLFLLIGAIIYYIRMKNKKKIKIDLGDNL